MKIKALFLSLLGAVAAFGMPANAQVISNQPSTVVNSSPFGHIILGGTAQQQNLFHSFSQLDTSSGQFVNFIASPNITNVISRVTDSATQINGPITITLDGTNLAPGVSLFLLSPQGIRFGPNAVTNIDEAFVASTASSLTFADGTAFEASSSQPATLTVSAPIGLQFGSSPAPITVEGINANLPSFGINSLLRRQNLLLIGGDVDFVGKGVALFAGRLQAAGLAESGEVSLTNSSGFLSGTLPTGVARADVSLNNGAKLYVNGPVESVNISANNLRLISPLGNDPNTRSEILVGAFAGATLPFRVGDININATGRVDVINSNLINGLGNGAVASLGDINIRARSLYLSDGSVVGSFNRGFGDTGDLNIEVDESIVIDGKDNPSFRDLTGLYSIVGDALFLQGSGQAGNINLIADSLTVANGGLITVSTLGEGNAGNIKIAANRVLLTGTNVPFGLSSTIASTVEATGVGNGGKIDIVASTLTLDRGAAIVGRTQGTGNAGLITLDLDVLDVSSGGQIATNSFTSGSSGSIAITARDRIQLSGSDPTYLQRLAISPLNAGGGESSGIYANTTPTSSGAGGFITLNTGDLSLSDTAQLSVSSQGTGSAGSLAISAGRVRLSQSTIQAESRSGNQGNIAIATPILLLRDRSQITTNATSSATGGNISLNAPLIIGTGNSDIVARATQGAGGNIKIKSSGLFGIAPRPQLTPSSDINASSELGFDGTVAISTPNIDPNSGLVELPSNLADSTNELSAGCSASQNTFTASGRGGLPENPLRTLANNRPWQDLRPIQASVQTPIEVERSPIQAQTVSTDQIAEATTWHRNSANEVILASAIAMPNPTTACLSRQTTPTAIAE